MSSPPPLPGTNSPANAPLVALPGYKPSGGIGPLSWPLMFVTALVAPALAAWLYNASAHFGTGLFSSMWAVLIGAVLLGVLTGALFFPAIHFGKVRSANLAALIGGLAGVLAFSVALGFEAAAHRGDIARVRIDSASSAAGAREGGKSRAALTQEYLALRAESGLEVTGRRVRATNISGTMFWALLGIEGLLSALTAAVAAFLWANRRYSEESSRWFTTKTIHNVLPRDVPALLEAAQARDWSQVAQIAASSKDPAFKEFKPPISVHYVSDKPGGILEIRAIADPKKPVATVYEEHLSDEELQIVWPAFPAPAGKRGESRFSA